MLRIERQAREAVERLVKRGNEAIEMMEFDGHPLTAQSLRTRLRQGETQLRQVIDDTMEAHRNGLLSERAVEKILGEALRKSGLANS
jgi:hypothetical protein